MSAIRFSVAALAAFASFASAVPTGLQRRTDIAKLNTVDANAVDATLAPNTTLIEELELAPTAVDRLLLLAADPKQLKFNFNVKPPGAGAGGQVVLANRKTFPALVDEGIATAVGFMNPCGLNTPHTHPRATEFLTVAQGSIKSGFFLETGKGVTELETDLSTLEGTVFPQGSIHWQFNDNCDDSVFISGLSGEDPGVSIIAQNFFSLNPDIVNATLGFPDQIDGKNIKDFALSIPPSFALGVQECLKRCNIKY